MVICSTNPQKNLLFGDCIPQKHILFGDCIPQLYSIIREYVRENTSIGLKLPRNRDHLIRYHTRRIAQTQDIISPRKMRKIHLVAIPYIGFLPP